MRIELNEIALDQAKGRTLNLIAACSSYSWPVIESELNRVLESFAGEPGEWARGDLAAQLLVSALLPDVIARLAATKYAEAEIVLDQRELLATAAVALDGALADIRAASGLDSDPQP